MDKEIKAGTEVLFHICGASYEHVVTEVLSPKKVVVRQGTPDNVFGPPEVFTQRKDGRWRKVGTGGTDGWIAIYPR